MSLWCGFEVRIFFEPSSWYHVGGSLLEVLRSLLRRARGLRPPKAPFLPKLAQDQSRSFYHSASIHNLAVDPESLNSVMSIYGVQGFRHKPLTIRNKMQSRRQRARSGSREKARQNGI